jgi:uncharacterized phage protein (TIGR02218 family)
MSKTVPAAIQADLDSGSVTLTTCIKITTVGGTVYGFTEWQADLVVDTVTYLSTGGYTPSDMSSSSNNNVDNMDFIGYFDASGIEFADVRAGLLDNAAVRIFSVNPLSISDGEIKQLAGTLGVISTGDVSFTAEIRGLYERLQQVIGNAISEGCRADLFDSECQIVQTAPDWTATTSMTVNDDGDAGTGDIVQPTTPNGYFYRCTVAGTTAGGEPTWPTTVGATVVDATVTWTTIRAYEATGTLTSQTNRAEMADSARTEPDDWWAGGVITFTSGTNNGIGREVKSYTVAAGTITTFMPFPYDIAGTETYTITAGCGKDFSIDCITKFNNIYNFRGEPYTPGLDAVNQTPRVK